MSLIENIYSLLDFQNSEVTNAVCVFIVYFDFFQFLETEQKTVLSLREELRLAEPKLKQVIEEKDSKTFVHVLLEITEW